MNAIRWAVIGVMALLLAGCSDTSPGTASGSLHAVQLDESGLIAAVGSPLVDEYSLDDGRGLNFRAENEPAFKLEFRAGRTNISWTEYSDEPAKFGSLNAENVKWAGQVFTYALGKEATAKIMSGVNGDKPLKFEHLGHEVRLMPSGGGIQALVTIALMKP